MTGHYVAHHRLIGYDPISDQPAFSLDIPKSKIGLLKTFIHFGKDDPEGYDSYKLDYSQVAEFVGSLRVPARPPQNLEHFVEPFDPKEQQHHRRARYR